jgi:hypothetical protein
MVSGSLEGLSSIKRRTWDQILGVGRQSTFLPVNIEHRFETFSCQEFVASVIHFVDLCCGRLKIFYDVYAPLDLYVLRDQGIVLQNINECIICPG